MDTSPKRAGIKYASDYLSFFFLVNFIATSTVVYKLQRYTHTTRWQRAIYDEQGTTEVPSTKPRGRPRHVTGEMMDTLKEHAAIDPCVDREETKMFVKNRFGKQTSLSTVSRKYELVFEDTMVLSRGPELETLEGCRSKICRW